MSKQDIDINRAEKLIAERRRKLIQQYEQELNAWLKERNIALSPTTIIRGNQIQTLVNVVLLPDNRNGAVNDVS